MHIREVAAAAAAAEVVEEEELPPTTPAIPAAAPPPAAAAPAAAPDDPAAAPYPARKRLVVASVLSTCSAFQHIVTQIHAGVGKKRAHVGVVDFMQSFKEGWLRCI